MMNHSPLLNRPVVAIFLQIALLTSTTTFTARGAASAPSSMAVLAISLPSGTSGIQIAGGSDTAEVYEVAATADLVGLDLSL